VAKACSTQIRTTVWAQSQADNSGHDGDDAQRSATAASDLHRQGDDHEAVCRKPIEIGEVFECGNLLGEQDLVRLEMGGLAEVDARCIEADAVDRSVVNKPPGRFGERPMVQCPAESAAISTPGYRLRQG
jgi:hypothetical protein